eukprot:TRINITY_DN5145_c0_g2_i1.p1 TRINITY_DN5145_c0_g2~~TRINITY_DN5145_c0_g2_i1.p1  ORF type:complete len:318 (+),score=63.61 TRINITY_DN5145_c0_g2_i1:47-955(+)
MASIAALCSELEELSVPGGRGPSLEAVEVNFEATTLHGEIEILEKEKDRVERELQERRALLMYTQGGVDIEKILKKAIKKIKELEMENALLKGTVEELVQKVVDSESQPSQPSRSQNSESGTEKSSEKSQKPETKPAIKRVASTTLQRPQNPTVPSTVTQTQGLGCKLGLSVAFDETRGVTITEVAQGSIAHTAGLRVSDVLLHFNKNSTRTLMEYKRVLKCIKLDAAIRVQIRRKSATEGSKESPMWLTIDPKAAPAPVPVLPLHTLPLTIAIKEREVAMRKTTKTQSKPRAVLHQFNRRV